MYKPVNPHTETDRLQVLRSLNILDTSTESEYDNITELASSIADMPITTISLIDTNRQWFKSCVGLDVKETEREISFCTWAIQHPEEPLIIPDATKDERFKDNPLVKNDPHIRFYAGFPIFYEGHALGTLCCLDYKTRQLSDFQIRSLKTLASNISKLLELRGEQQKLRSDKELFIKALNLNSSFFLILENGNRIQEIGYNFYKSIPELKKGDLFVEHFRWSSRFSLEAFLLSNREEHKGLVLIDSLTHDQRYKCSLSKIRNQVILCASPVVNFEYPIENYRLKTKDFAPHDSILEFLFLQETTARNITEARTINQKITDKSVQLEKLIEVLKEKEKELTESNEQNEKQKIFYENILNNFPTDIAVFSIDHRYVYLNSIAVKSRETREWMIGKTDYDYADLKGGDYSIPDKRRSAFLSVKETKQFIEWEDEYKLDNGRRRVLLRRFSPVLNEKGELMNIIGYGAEITNLKEYQYEIESKNEEILRINENLEKLVEEKTLKNNELSQMLSTQDKLAMIGEVTAGITHDLNTPLSSILLGSDNLQEMIESLLHNTLSKCTREQLEFSCKRAKEKEMSIYSGGLQASRDIASLEQMIIQDFPEHEENAKELAKALTKAKVKPEEKEVVAYILSSPNSTHFIDLIYHINGIRFFLLTIHQAALRSSGVIKNLRYYLKEGSVAEQTKVHLKTSIETVLSIFNHELQRGVDVHMDIPDHIYISAYESKIYQLWSNIIKNAIDAMERKGNLYIKVKEEKKQIEITISNDGPMIPPDIRERIFDKFFTTKDAVRGTGLGLNIVKQVIDEHKGKIQVTSDEHLTSFRLQLPK